MARLTIANDARYGQNMTNLDQYIRETGTTAKRIALDVGVSEPYICDLRYGRRRPSRDVAARIAQATGGKVPESAWQAGDR